MKTYEIWSEGYLTNGMDGIPSRAHLHGTEVGETFGDACHKFFVTRGMDQGRTYYNPTHGTYYGCKLFDNADDARKLFG